ncbi:homologous-pairing protein 2 homolog [Lineus longissimus]|uniref:homologous-pairing protein 2 homolog n=1 Tax=Lineus longissimus TaxID=88925 RepID=UPI002B4F40E9
MMSKSKEAEASAAVLGYLNRQNRPYSANDIFNNLHKEFGKTAVEKCLESMADDGKIKRKLNGKQKVYAADQTQFPSADEAELHAMDEEISQLQQQVKSATDEYRKLDKELHLFNSAISTEDAQQQLEEVTKVIAAKKTKLKDIKSAGNVISPKEKEQITKFWEKNVKEWRKRKRMTNDILNAVLEGYPKKKKDLYEDIGIETDEDCKVTPPEL